jgi:hypothetical protein
MLELRKRQDDLEDVKGGVAKASDEGNEDKPTGTTTDSLTDFPNSAPTSPPVAAATSSAESVAITPVRSLLAPLDISSHPRIASSNVSRASSIKSY